MSSAEAEKALGVSREAVYYLFKELVARDVGFLRVVVDYSGVKHSYVVRDDEKCLSELRSYVYARYGLEVQPFEAGRVGVRIER